MTHALDKGHCLFASPGAKTRNRNQSLHAQILHSGPVPFLCRPKGSFKPPFVEKRPGFSSPVLSAVVVDLKAVDVFEDRHPGRPAGFP